MTPDDKTTYPLPESAHKDIRVFRFKTLLLKGRTGLEFRSDGPIPIYNENDKLLGFGTATEFGAYSLLDCAIDPATPERLDLEIMAKTYWVDAVLEYRGFISDFGGYKPTIAHIKGLILTTTPVPGQEPLDPSIGSPAMSVYNTFSFWLCVVLAAINAGLMIVTDILQRSDLHALAFSCVLLCSFGAFSHWYLERKYSKRKAR